MWFRASTNRSEIVFRENTTGFLRRLLRAVDERDIAHDVGNDGCEQRIMRATQHK
jgi:hypothetical protein